MYEVFYNFKAEPFRLSPDHKFCYEHKSYAKARAYMAYAFKRAEGFVMITGRPGTGKTTLIGELVESLAKDRVCTANLVCTQLQADDLLKSVAFNFGVGSTGVDKAEMLQRLTLLLHRWHREGRRALLIVDEAQDLSLSAMEELRLLTNIQIGGQPLLQIFLVGQPELRELILSPEMEQVHQRIVAASHIEGLGVEETESYVLHRLSVVGWRGDPALDRSIFPLIHKYSEGVPRRINLICSRLFLLGSVEQRHDIQAEDVRVVITELQAENLAAGTGISPEDFDQVDEPDWVRAPQSEPHSSTAPQLRAVDHEQKAAVDESPLEPLAGAKKKDSPDLTSYPSSNAGNLSDALDRSAIYYEDEPEYDQDQGIESFSDPLPAPLQASAHRVRDNSFTTGSATAFKPATSSRRPVLFACAAVAILAVVVWAYFSKRDAGSRVELEHTAEARASHFADLSSANGIPQSQAAIASKARDATLEPETEGDEPGLPPANALAEESAEAPTMAPTIRPDAVSELVVHVESSDQNELASASELPADSAEVAGNTEEVDSPDELNDIGEEDARAAELSVPGTAPEPTISINFAFDSDDLDQEAYVALDQAVIMLKERPDSIAAITGFTDNQGDEDYNLVLSRKRADAVRQYLVDAGIEQDRLRVEGRGALTDIAMGSSSEDEDSLEPYRVVQIELSSDQ